MPILTYPFEAVTLFIKLFKPLILLENSKVEDQISTIEGQCPGTSSQTTIHTTTDIKTTPGETSTAKYTSSIKSILTSIVKLTTTKGIYDNNNTNYNCINFIFFFFLVDVQYK